MKKTGFVILLAIAAILAVSCATAKEPVYYESREIPAALTAFEKYATPYRMADDDNLHFYFVSASNGYVRTSNKTGDSCLILFPNGETMLVDCAEGLYAQMLITNLLKMGVTDIDYLVMTHPHSDHAGGIYKDEQFSILDYFNVGQLFYSGIKANVTTRVLTKVSDYGIPYTTLNEGAVLEIGDARVTVINPPENVIGTTSSEEAVINNSSIAFRLDYGEFSALFTGDMYLDAEYRVIEEHPELLDVDFLKVCHHGRDTSSCASFLEAVSPKLAVTTGNCVMETVTYKRFKENNIEVLFDFLDGFVHVWSDGKDMFSEHSIAERKTSMYD